MATAASPSPLASVSLSSPKVFIHQRTLVAPHHSSCSARRGSVSVVRVRAEQLVSAPAAESSKKGTFALFGGQQKAVEERLLGALSDVKGRGRGASTEKLQEVLDAVAELEALGGIKNPVYSSKIEGSWKLLFTTRPGTASPIQRTFVGVDAFSVFQQLSLSAEQRVANIVAFGDKIGQLKVEAAATAASGERVAFRFDRAAFELRFWPYRVPYPVPFRLLGDEAVGWLDTPYLSPSGQIRISKGNKGSTFVLQKYFSPQEILLQTIRRGSSSSILRAVDEVVALNPTPAPARSSLSSGTWKLLWTSQARTASKIESFSVGLAKNYQIVDGRNRRLETIVQFLPGVVLRAGASTSVASRSVTDIVIDSASLSLGSVTIPVNIRGTGNVDILYVDEKLRISIGNKGSIYVQQRETNPPGWL